MIKGKMKSLKDKIAGSKEPEKKVEIKVAKKSKNK